MHINILNPVYVAIPLEMVSKRKRENDASRSNKNHTSLDIRRTRVVSPGYRSKYLYITHGTIILYRRLLLSFTVKTVHNVFEWGATSKKCNEGENKCCLENYKINQRLISFLQSYFEDTISQIHMIKK